MSAAKAINVAIKVAAAQAGRLRSRNSSEVEGFSFHLPKGGRAGHTLKAFDTGYITVGKSIQDGKRRRAHLALLSAGITKKAQTRRYIPDGTVSQMSPWFPTVFQGMRVPVLTAWYPQLWTYGIRNKLLVKPGVCYGRSVWIVADEAAWSSLVTKLVSEGTLQGLEEIRHG